MTENANLYARFAQHFPADSATVLLNCGEAERSNYSYGDMQTESARIANYLLQQGARPGDRVSVQVDKSPANLFLYLACLRAGLVYHPLNTAYQASELAYFIDNAEPRLIICDPANEPVFASLRGDHKFLTLDADGKGTLIDGAEQQASDIETHFAAPDTTAALLYSSGTTGRPKGIMLSHRNLYSSADTLVQAWGFGQEDCLLHALPIYHVHGLFVATGCVLMSGASMRWHNHFEARAVCDDLPHSTVMMGVPTFYTRLLQLEQFDRHSCAQIRLFISGSAPLLVETFHEFETRSGHTILERYGMTETSMNTSNPLQGQRKAGTVGPALPGVTVRVVDESGAEVAQGDTGNLQVRGDNVFPGYWCMPEKTAEDFTADGFFNTGDKASIDSDGYVSIVGRAKDMIITGGLNVYPKEIELVLDEIPGVAESAVIGIADADFGEAVVAVLVADSAEVAADFVIAHCRGLLANFKLPKQVHYVSQLPRNAMGKVQKNQLRETYRENNK